MIRKLSEAELHEALTGLAGWSLEKGKLHREYRFGSFAEAMGFMTIAAIGIEKMNHHPEWFNVYNRVNVDLTTHDAGGISARDFDLARLLDSVAQKLQ